MDDIPTITFWLSHTGNRMSAVTEEEACRLSQEAKLFLKIGTVCADLDRDIRKSDIIVGASADQPCIRDLDEGKEFFMSMKQAAGSHCVALVKFPKLWWTLI